MNMRTAYMSSGLLLGTLSGCATYRTCGFEGCAGDANITAEVQQLFTQHAALQPPNLITVQTYNHVVYLYGLVDTELQRTIATEVAAQAPGSIKVVNSIGISGNF